MRNVATVSGAVLTGPYLLSAAEPNKKLGLAFIGTGGQGGAHIGLSSSEHCVAYTDVDRGRWDKISKLAPNAVGYTDYRKMYDKHEKEIDAVVIAIPDHSHAAASMMAIKRGKHCYTEKPLTWSIDEARALAEAAAKYKVATQMGNMGHANEGNRLVVEWVRGGVIGDVTEVHTWTNRPVWPQGIETRPATEPVPANLDWDCWIGPAPYRDYHKGLHSFAWRGWFDFGCGAIGDMGCHTWDCVFWAMNPDYPSSVELVKIEGRTKETYPKRCQIKWDFPAKGNRPAFVAYWYEGGMKPPVPEEMLNDPTRKPKDPKKGIELPGSGSLFIGTKGKLLVAGDYADSPRLIPESFMKEAKRPDKSIPRSPGHKPEWLMACRGDKPIDFPGSNFTGYAGPLTEVMLVGAIAIRLGEVGGKIECDAVQRTIKTSEALAFSGRRYREGWSL
jgi:predicted dehydrogenase